MSNKDTVCNLLWNWPLVDLANPATSSCCKNPYIPATEQDIKFYGKDIFLNRPEHLQRRLDLVKGVKTQSCRQCWHAEDAGMVSMRQRDGGPAKFMGAHRDRMLEEFGTDDLEVVANSVKIDSHLLKARTPQTLEINLGNLCDLKCVYCNATRSSQWASEDLKKGKITKQQYDILLGEPNVEFTELFWKWVDEDAKHSLTALDIVGGEPLINPKLYQIFDKLIETCSDTTQPIKLYIITNLNTPANLMDKCLAYIEKLPANFTVIFGVSCEALEARAEYIRTGLDWSTFVTNLRKIYVAAKTTTKVKVMHQLTINALCIPTLSEFIKWIAAFGNEHGITSMMRVVTVIIPEEFTATRLPVEFAKYVDDAITFCNENKIYLQHVPQLQQIADSIRNAQKSPEHHTKFCDKIDWLDARMKLQFKDTFPELVSYYETGK